MWVLLVSISIALVAHFSLLLFMIIRELKNVVEVLVYFGQKIPYKVSVDLPVTKKDPQSNITIFNSAVKE